MASGKKKVPMLRYLYIAILRFVLAVAGNHAGEGLEIALREYAFSKVNGVPADWVVFV